MLRFQLKTINQTCILLKLITPLSNMIFIDSAIFIEKMVADQLLQKVQIWW
jgi:hypothetical protein